MAVYIYPFSTATEADQRLVWAKGIIVPSYDERDWRRDRCGAWMKFSDHGNTNSQFGWEIDHMYPASLGGSNQLSNLQPLQWQNNRAKGDAYPWSCGR